MTEFELCRVLFWKRAHRRKRLGKVIYVESADLSFSCLRRCLPQGSPRGFLFLFPSRLSFVEPVDLAVPLAPTKLQRQPSQQARLGGANGTSA
jgi:hypothetical protein